MTFASREDAGRRLACHLLENSVDGEVVLGLPRGGIVVAAEVARVLRRPLDALVVRKIGHPFHREFAVGAMAEGDVVILDEPVIGSGTPMREALEEITRDEQARLREYELKFHVGPGWDLAARRVLIVDDGLATGATMEAAVLSARKRGAREIIVAVPVASVSAVARLKRVADGVMALLVDPEFGAVGSYYESFSQTTDEEVAALLKSAQGAC
jgi:predicted phosphoribosyltransferase